MATDARVLSARSVGRSRCTSIGSSRNPRRKNAPIGWRPSPTGLACPGRRSTAASFHRHLPRRRVARRPFIDPDPFQTLAYPNIIAAKLAVADEIGMALAKVTAEDRAFIDALLRETLAKDTVLARVRAHFKNRTAGGG